MNEFSIVLPDTRRFDDRTLKCGKDDGADFEAFVFEILKLADTGAGGLRRGLARSNDGAIDLLGTADGKIVVFECKFVGKSAKDGATARWKEVAKNLKSNLPVVAAKISNNSLYRPWLSRTNPIQQYVFCTSAILGSEAERQQLAKLIKKDFEEIASLHAELSHLASVEVDVRDWAVFHGIVSSSFSIRYRWYGDLPKGIEPLEFSERELRSFKRFLVSTGLPYLSRQKYADVVGGVSRIETEDEVISEIEAQKFEALIISGEGGVGKTRLAFEICRMLSARNWVSLRLTRFADRESVQNLVKAHLEAGRIALFVDYAEAADALPEILDEVRRIGQSNSHRLCVIATCRASALGKVHEGFLASQLDIKTVLFGSAKSSTGSDSGYSEWVSRCILERIPDQQRPMLVKLCSGLPVLAAFVVYLLQRSTIEFSRQFGEFLETDDFPSWATRRINMLSRESVNPKEIKHKLAKLALILPISEDDFDRVLVGSADVPYQALLTDHWIERVDGQVQAVHDVFADAISANYLFESPYERDDRIVSLLSETVEEQTIGQSIVSFDRLASHKDFSRTGGVTIARRILAKFPSHLQTLLPQLWKSELLSAEGRYELLAQNAGWREIIGGDRQCDIALLSMLEVDGLNPKENGWLLNLLRNAISQNPNTNIHLRMAYEQFPHEFEADVLARIDDYPVIHQTQFLIVSALKNNVSLSVMRANVGTWTKSLCGSTDKASFVYAAWLDAKGDPELVREPIGHWLKDHQTDEAAQFVFKAWLDAKGAPELVREPIGHWLKDHQTDEAAGFVYQAWLEATGDFSWVASSCLQWFQLNVENPEAVFPLKFISRQQHLPEDAVKAIAIWCINFAHLPDTIWRICSALRQHRGKSVGRGLAVALIPVLDHLEFERFQSGGKKEDEDQQLLSFIVMVSCEYVLELLPSSSKPLFSAIIKKLTTNTDIVSLASAKDKYTMSYAMAKFLKD